MYILLILLLNIVALKLKIGHVSTSKNQFLLHFVALEFVKCTYTHNIWYLYRTSFWYMYMKIGSCLWENCDLTSGDNENDAWSHDAYLLCSTVFYSATMVCACASYSILHKISTTPTMRVVFLCNIGWIPSVLLIFSLQYILCIMSNNVCCMYTSINLGLPQ